MGSGTKNKKQKKGYGVMPDYLPTDDQRKHYAWCINNNIRIFTALQNYADNNLWKIGISIGPEYKKHHLSPSTYTDDNVMIEMYKMCEYYYKKYKDE